MLSAGSLRFDRVDAFRGFAMVWMTIFHFCFDLNYFGFLNQNFYEDSFWTRWKQVAGAALLVSLGSYFIYPESYIYFGVLHAIAVMLIIMRLTYRLKYGLWVLGFLLIGAKFCCRRFLRPLALR